MNPPCICHVLRDDDIDSLCTFLSPPPRTGISHSSHRRQSLKTRSRSQFCAVRRIRPCLRNTLQSVFASPFRFAFKHVAVAYEDEREHPTAKLISRSSKGIRPYLHLHNCPSSSAFTFRLALQHFAIANENITDNKITLLFPIILASLDLEPRFYLLNCRRSFVVTIFQAKLLIYPFYFMNPISTYASVSPTAMAQHSASDDFNLRFTQCSLFFAFLLHKRHIRLHRR